MAGARAVLGRVAVRDAARAQAAGRPTPDLDEAQRAGLAQTMQRLMRRYDALFDQPMPFSMGWHQAPFGGDATEPWQVHAHFMPPLLEATKRKFMVGYELLSEPQRDISAEEAAASPACRRAPRHGRRPRAPRGGSTRGLVTRPADRPGRGPRSPRRRALGPAHHRRRHRRLRGAPRRHLPRTQGCTHRAGRPGGGHLVALVTPDPRGLRYLEDLRLQLVREALAERSRLLTWRPTWSSWNASSSRSTAGRSCIVPSWVPGLTLYDLLGAARDGGRAHHLGPDAVAELTRHPPQGSAAG